MDQKYLKDKFMAKEDLKAAKEVYFADIIEENKTTLGTTFFQ